MSDQRIRMKSDLEEQRRYYERMEYRVRLLAVCERETAMASVIRRLISTVVRARH